MEEITVDDHPVIEEDDFDRKIIRVVTAVVMAMIVAVFIWSVSYTVSVPPHVESFYTDEVSTIPAEDNGWFGIWGLTAPEDEDITDFGYRKIDGLMKDPDWTDSGELFIDFTYDDISCYADPGGLGAQAMEEDIPCPGLSEFKKFLVHNGEFLKRYTALYNYKTYSAPVIENGFEDIFGDGENIGSFQLISFLKLAHHTYLAKNRQPETALKEWYKQMSFLKRLLQTRMGSGEFQLVMEVYSWGQFQLPYILSKKPSLATKYKKQLTKLLTPLGPDKWPVEDVTIHDGLWNLVVIPTEGIGGVKLKDLNLYKVRYYDFAQAIAEARDKGPRGFVDVMDDVEDDHAKISVIPDLPHPIKSMLVTSKIQDAYYGWYWNMSQMYNLDDTSNMLVLFLNALSDRIKDRDMEDYLGKQKPPFRNSFTGTAFRWHGGQICTTYPEDVQDEDFCLPVRFDR